MFSSGGSPIDRVEVLTLGPDLPRHAYTGHPPAPYTTSTLVRITDADGAQGLGQFDSDSYGAFDLAPLETLRTLAPRLIGRDPLDRVATWDELRDHGTAPDMPGVRSALDIAHWDLAARRAGVPLHELIVSRPNGVAPERLPAYASLPTLASPASYAEDVERYTAEGYTAFKIHAWGDAERDLEAIRAAREVAGDAVALIYDAEGCFDRPTAERMMPALGDLGVRWFEAPLPDLDLEGYRRLVRLGGVAIVPAGDAIWDERLMTEILRDPPWSAMRFDVTFAGGITSALRLFDVATAHDLRVELTSYGQTLVQAANLHVMLAFGRTNFFERAVPSAEFEFGVTTPLTMDAAGTVGALAAPGLGVELDDDAIASAVLARFSVDTSG
jgi:L-alanine-DL-glutamate epimerase-like enolase superfamily enzyme